MSLKKKTTQLIQLQLQRKVMQIRTLGNALKKKGIYSTQYNHRELYHFYHSHVFSCLLGGLHFRIT